MAIQFDDTNLLARMVGAADGVTAEELAAAEPLARAALAGVKTLTDGGTIGFPNLPKDADLANQIVAYAAKVRASYDTICLVGIGGSALPFPRSAVRGPAIVVRLYH